MVYKGQFAKKQRAIIQWLSSEIEKDR